MDVATPSEIQPAITSVASTVGTILDKMLSGGGEGVSGGSGGGNSTGNDTAAAAAEDDPCASVPIVDKLNADKPGVVEYETDIGDSRE